VLLKKAVLSVKKELIGNFSMKKISICNYFMPFCEKNDLKNKGKQIKKLFL
jgi:hypothetical protein